MHCMYVVRCADGTLYTGYSPDVEARVAAHNAGKGAKYTKARLPVELVASAAFPTKHEALSAEWHFKQLSRTRKDGLLAQARVEPFERVLARMFDLGAAGAERPAAPDVPAAPAEVDPPDALTMDAPALAADPAAVVDAPASAGDALALGTPAADSPATLA